MLYNHDVKTEETSARPLPFFAAQQPLKTLNIMRADKETYPLYEKKVVGNAQAKDEQKNEENRSFTGAVTSALIKGKNRLGYRNSTDLLLCKRDRQKHVTTTARV